MRILKQALGVVAVAAAMFAWIGRPASARADEGDTSGDVVVSPKVDYGVGIRLRRIYVPQAVLELFVAQASSSVSHNGFGAEFVRRHGNFELSLGVEYENVSPKDGLWLKKGDQPPAQSPDYVEFNGLSWYDADFTFTWQKPLSKIFAFRYGAGFGLGIVQGQVLQTHTTCTGASTSTCTAISQPMPGEKYKTPSKNVPPVFPVVNALIGLQIRPLDHLSVDIEAGIRSVGYAGVTADYFF